MWRKTMLTAVKTTTLLKPDSKDFFSSEEIISELYNSGLKMLAPTTNDELYNRVVEELKKLISADYVSIYFVKSGTLTKVFTTLDQLNDIYPRKDGFTHRAFYESVPYILDSREVFTIHPQVEELGIKSILFIPLTFNWEPVGVISVDFLRPTELPDYILQALKLFGSIITFKLKNLQLHQQLTEMIENQTLFISLASHELKNPLTTVKAYASLIQKQLKEGKRVQPRTTNLLLSEVQRMADLINELLNSKKSRIQENLLQYDKKLYSLRQIIHHAITNFHFTHPKRTIFFEDKAAENDMVWVDYHKIIQMLSNILNNAAKFSNESTRIKLVIDDTKEMLTVKIIDQGQGISKKDLPYIFDQFYKGRYSEGGMGLGLYLCKKIVEDHQGEIIVTSQPGKITTFSVSLPKFS